MNKQSFERQLQQIDPPVPDPAARLRARHAAVAEFERLHPRRASKPATSWWVMPRSWLGGFAAACLGIVGVSIFWLAPEGDRVLAPLQDLPASASVSEAQAALQEQPPVETAGSPVTPATPAAPAAVRKQATAVAPAIAAEAAVTAEAVDLNVIPSNLPQSVDTVTAGLAQQAPAAIESDESLELSEVQVTGTRMLQPNATSTNPITSITQEEMQRLGIVNIADALTMLVPQNISAYTPSLTGDQQGQAPAARAGGARGAAPPAAGAGAGAGAGMERARSEAFIGNTIANLRGMDPEFGSRTLTLVDGRRVVSTSSQADVVDLNIIPSNLLERMDVVTGGASATYGSGAMAGVVNLVVPPSQGQADRIGGEKFEQFAVNPVKRTVDEPVSTFSIDVDTASYSFVRRQLTDGVLPPAGAVRTEEMLNYFDYDWPAADSRDEPFKPTVTVSDSPWGTGRKLVHVAIKGYELPAKQRPDVNMVLLIDVSGSMNSPDKLPLAQRSLALLLDSLKPTDTVGIAVYAGAAGEVLPPTPVRNKDVILQALNSLRPGGSTAGVAGIRVAYDMAARSFRRGGVNRILLATDGDFNVGISDPDELKRFVEQQRGRGIMLSVLGFGTGNYRDDIAQALAQNGNGVAAYIDTVSEARKVLVQQAGSQLFTIAKDVKLQVEFNPATVAEYRLVGYETRALAREDFNNDKVDAGDVGAGHTVTAIYEITPVDAAARQVDERRYGADEKPAAAPARGKADEYGYLKIRYKLPDSNTSQLIEQPIGVNAGVPRALRRDVQFATAVAGFAQLLQGGRYTGRLGYDDVFRLAQGALGEDAHGHRAEFLQLVRRAQGTLPR